MFLRMIFACSLVLMSFGVSTLVAEERMEPLTSESFEEFSERLAADRAKIFEQGWTFWNEMGQFEKPMQQRLLSLTPSLAELSRLYMDYFFSYGKESRQPSPQVVHFDSALKRDLELAIESLPEAVKKSLAPYLAAIVPVRNFKVNGLAALLLDHEHRHQRGGIAFLNIDTLDAKANDWWTMKESSPYKSADGEPSYSLQARIDIHEGENNRVRALQYIVLHELGHILAYGRDVFPRWDVPLKEPYAVGDYPYLDFSWRLQNRKEVLRPHEERHLTDFIGKLVYFKDESQVKLQNQDMPVLFQSLKETSLISPYAILHPHEDFAELFALYVLVKYQGLRPSMRVVNDQGEVVVEHDIFKAIYSEKFDEKRRFLDRLLEN